VHKEYLDDFIHCLVERITWYEFLPCFHIHLQRFSIFQKKAVGGDLYRWVFYSLDLIEKDYFGLQYTDADNVEVCV